MLSLFHRHGVVSYADSLDTVGVLAQNVQKVEKVFGSINKRDFNDPTSVSERLREKARLIAMERIQRWDTESLEGLRIGVPQVRIQRSILRASFHDRTGILPFRTQFSIQSYPIRYPPLTSSASFARGVHRSCVTSFYQVRSERVLCHC